MVHQGYHVISQVPKVKSKEVLTLIMLKATGHHCEKNQRGEGGMELFLAL